MNKRGERAGLKEDGYCRAAESENGKIKKVETKKVIVEQVEKEGLFSAARCTFSSGDNIMAQEGESFRGTKITHTGAKKSWCDGFVCCVNSILMSIEMV